MCETKHLYRIVKTLFLVASVAPMSATCVSSAMFSPTPTERDASSYPTPRTHSTAKMLTELKCHMKPSSNIRKEVSLASTLGTAPLPSSKKKEYTFSAEEDKVEEKALNYLDRTGYLSQVAGSQSLLSQELLADGDQESQAEVQSSQITNLSTTSPQSIARRYGILTQETTEDDENRSTSAGTTRKSLISYQTPPRSTAQRKIVTVTSQKQNPHQDPDLEDDALHETQPSLSLSMLEEAVGDSTLVGSQMTDEVPSASLASIVSTGKRKRRSSTSSTDSQPFASLCTAADMAKNIENRADNDESKPRPNAARKATSFKKSASDEAVGGEIQWVGSVSRLRTVDKEQQERARQAADIAHRIIEGENDLAKRLLLSMALERDSPRQPPTALPPPGPIPEGFVWAHYPPLEAVLKENMAEYYELSMAKCQSTRQQAFNNTLVDLMRDVAASHGYSFPTDRRTLRDRIRCYYKTHIQNAKKRLRTCLRNPTKKANARNLLKLMDILPDTESVVNQES